MKITLLKYLIPSMLFNMLLGCQHSQPDIPEVQYIPPKGLTFVSELEDFESRPYTTRYRLQNLLNENVTVQEVVEFAQKHSFEADYADLVKPIGVPAPQIFKGVKALEAFYRGALNEVPYRAQNLQDPELWQFVLVLNEGDKWHLFGFDPTGKLRWIS
jgi:hypothetical protein